MVSATFLKVCRQSDELSASTKYAFYPEYKYLHVNIYIHIFTMTVRKALPRNIRQKQNFNLIFFVSFKN